jgi:transposase/plasmid stability protein
MPMQLHLPMHPAGAREINAVVAMLEQDEHVAYFASGVPLFVHRAGDAVGRRVAAGQMIALGLARQEELSAALQINRTTLYRQQRKIQAHGVLGVVDAKRGPRRPHRFTADKRDRAAQLLEAGQSIRQAAVQVGVTEGTIRHALRRGDLRPAPPGVVAGVGPRTRSEQAAGAIGGVAVQRHTERALARLGHLTEAAPRFVAADAVRAGGVLLALPAVLSLGLLEAGQQVYGRLKKGFYGLQATLLCLTVMALLRIRTPEQLQGQPPGELGIVLGLDRAPEVKTLRRKLAELAARRQATPFSQRLAERWVRDQADAVGLLYIDGHVRPYHGTAQTLPEAYVTRRRLCMPATTDVWVQQQDAQPLFVVTAPANDNLLAMLRREILPEVRRLVGERRVTLCFDREGWSPKFFRECHGDGFDVLTYRRGPYAAWRRGAFRPITATVDGREVHYRLAERLVAVAPEFRMREVRRLCDTGHQTAILTTRDDLPLATVAYRMFERWTQENFFRYMRQHFALDALLTYAVEPADPERTIPNPARKVLRKQLAEARTTLTALEQDYGRAAQQNPEGRRPTMRGFKIAHGALGQQIRAQAQVCHRLDVRLKALPDRVPLKTVLAEEEIVKLAPEAKHLTDTIKMVAYRAETALVRSLAPHYARTEDEGRALLREMLSSTADIVPDAERLRIRLHSLANPRSNQALAHLCTTLNALGLQYPGTTLTLVYEPPGVA